MTTSNFGQFQPLGSNFNGEGNVTPNTIWGDLGEFEPQIPYFGAIQRQPSLSTNQREYFQNNFSDVFNQYQGMLDQQIRQGLNPSLRWGDFINNYNFQDAWRQLPFDQRGTNNIRQFSPFVQWFI